MKSPVLFYQSVYDDYKNNPNKNLILMAGPSSSGKGFESKNLANYFRDKGENVIVVEADNYYKGIARIIVEKAIKQDGFSKFQNQLDEIAFLVRNVIEFSDFSDKFSEENYNKLIDVLSPIFNDRTREFVEAIKVQKDKINFDEPFAINFESLASDINKLVNGESIQELTYSFDTSESTYSDKTINAEGNDVVIVEGLYVLRDELLDAIDYDRTIRCGINCDIKTLMSRRFDRDIRGGRSTLTPGQTMEIFINTVMPAYFRFIKPTMLYAEHIFDATLTEQELNKRARSNQMKFVAPENMEDLLRGIDLISKEEQVDYFFEDGNDSGITLRIRSNGELVYQICLKAGKNISDRAIDEYDVATALPPSKRNVDEFVKNLMNAGFTPTDMIRKTRNVCSLNGIQFTLDDIDGLGKFIEIENKYGIDNDEQLARVKYIQAKLGIESEPINKSYRDIKNEHLRKEDSQEVERKFKLEMTDKDFDSLIENKNLKHITQYYLDLSQENIQKFLITCFDGDIRFSQFAEARIRIINKERAYITLKSRGSESRIELEKEIPLPLAEKYIGSALSYIEKDRFVVNDKESGLKLEIDNFQNRDLRLIEVEYNPDTETPGSIRDIVIRNLGDISYELTDVTKSYEFKNRNLATELDAESSLI